ncbi:hypothetical protein KOW79_003709 [Hemibagrus wyckioides]|uniref:Uncharacterized protein n=1 Tax=Hemibagrus wyckioides TaxID=337641 RepID=A0A9D3SVS1_9TELE|nr:hypothetical protein KOW79_003709 [Hemibagrus wyckioides]
MFPPLSLRKKPLLGPGSLTSDPELDASSLSYTSVHHLKVILNQYNIYVIFWPSYPPTYRLCSSISHQL